MLFLPISEGTFINAKDPLLVQNQEAGNCAKGAHCRMSNLGNYKTSLNVAGNNKSTGQQLVYALHTDDIGDD